MASRLEFDEEELRMFILTHSKLPFDTKVALKLKGKNEKGESEKITVELKEPTEDEMSGMKNKFKHTVASFK